MDQVEKAVQGEVLDETGSTRTLPGSAAEAMSSGMSVLMGVRSEYVRNRDGTIFVSIVDSSSGSGRAEFAVPAEQVFPSDTGMFGYKSFDVVLGQPGDVIETVQTARNRGVVWKEAGEIAAEFDPAAQVGWRGGMAPKYMVAPDLIDRGEAYWLRGVSEAALSPEAQGPDGPFRLMALELPDGTGYVPIASCRAMERKDGKYDVFLGYGPERVVTYIGSDKVAVGTNQLAWWYQETPQDMAFAPVSPPDVSLAPNDAWLHGVRGKYVGSIKDQGGHRLKEVSVADQDSPTGRSVFAVEDCCVVDLGNGRRDVLIGREGYNLLCAVEKESAEPRRVADILEGFDLEQQIDQAVRDGTAVMGPDGRPTLQRMLSGQDHYNTGKSFTLEGVRYGNAINIGHGTWLISVTDWDSPGGVLRFLSDSATPHPGEPAGSYDVTLGAGWDVARADRPYVMNGHIAKAFDEHRQDALPEAEMPEGHGGFVGMTGGNLFDISWDDVRNRGRVGVRVPDIRAKGGYGYISVPLRQVSVSNGEVMVDLGQLDHSAGWYKWKDKDGDAHQLKMRVGEVCELAEQSVAGTGISVETRPSGKQLPAKARQAAPEGKSVNMDPASRTDFEVKDTSKREEPPKLGGTMGQWARVVRRDDGSYALRGVEMIRMQGVKGSDLKKVYVRDPESSSKLRACLVKGSDIVPEPDRNTYTVLLGQADRPVNCQYERDGKQVAGMVPVGKILSLYDADCAERSMFAAKTCRLDGLMPGRDIMPAKDGYVDVRIPDSGVSGGYGELTIRRDALEARDGLMSLKLGLRDEVLVGYHLPGDGTGGAVRSRRATVGYLVDESSKESFERRKEAETPEEQKQEAKQTVQEGPKSRGREVWLSEIPRSCVSLPQLRDGRLVIDILVPDTVSPYGVGVVTVPRDKVTESSAGIEAMIGYANEAVQGYAVYERYDGDRARRAYCLRTAGEIYEAMKEGRGTLEARAKSVPALGMEEPGVSGVSEPGRDVTD